MSLSTEQIGWILQIGCIVGVTVILFSLFCITLVICLSSSSMVTVRAPSLTTHTSRTQHPSIVQIQSPRIREEAVDSHQPPPAYPSLSSQTSISSFISYRLQSDYQQLPPYSENSHSTVVGMQPQRPSLPVPLYQGHIAPETANPYLPGIVPIQRERSDLSASAALYQEEATNDDIRTIQDLFFIVNAWLDT